MYNEDDYLLLSGIQHFSFCRRQWALIHIEEKWNENALTAEGRYIHERVHNADISDMRNGILTVRDLPIKSDTLGVTGCCDAVEFVPSPEGIPLYHREGTWKVRPVEYKRGTSKFGDCDRLQVTAQVMCLEEMFCCRIGEACIYYNETRRREKLEITQDLRCAVRRCFAEMHEFYRRGYTPKVKPHKGCRNCSLAELCLPSLLKDKKMKSVSAYLNTAFEGEPE